MAARFMVKRGGDDTKLTHLASQIVTTTERATQILNDLLDVTRLAFGTEIPVAKARMDMGQLGLQLVDEMRTVSNGRAIEISIVGDTEGEWDQARMGQVLSNLIGNALQYSPETVLCLSTSPVRKRTCAFPCIMMATRSPPAKPAERGDRQAGALAEYGSLAGGPF
jgi:signal transduction histidine kinase